MKPSQKNDDQTSNKRKRKLTNEKPISLHPLTVEEALRKAMDAPTPEDESKPEKKPTKKGKKKNANK